MKDKCVAIRAIKEKATGRDWSQQRGFTMLELTFVILVAAVISAVAIPATKNALSAYRLNAAVSAVRGAIQTTRYQAIMQGYHYNVAFTQTTRTYQVNRKIPPASTFSAVGGLVSWASTSDLSMTPTTTLEFLPGGTITATTGSLTFTITNGTTNETITVSQVGDVTVTP
jgi:prepilin-type N-terminal cleavage/methylation domain-containing protein